MCNCFGLVFNLYSLHFRFPLLYKGLNKPSDGEDRRNTSQYKEALQNMAALMTDVDLTDDVMNDLKQRFDLK